MNWPPLRLENTGKVSGAFEIDLDAGWCSALNLADGWQTFKTRMYLRPPTTPTELATSRETNNGADL